MKTITNLQAVHKYLLEHGNPEITKMFVEGLKEVHKTFEKDMDEAFRLMDEIYAVMDKAFHLMDEIYAVIGHD